MKIGFTGLGNAGSAVAKNPGLPGAAAAVLNAHYDMEGGAFRDPRWVDAILDWSGTWFVSRVVLTAVFLIGGVTKLLNFPAAVAEQDQLGLHPGAVWAALAIIVELVGPILVISGYFVWLGAGALGVLTAIAAVAAHPFWDLQGPARFMAINYFFEHLALVAGCVLAALLAEHADRERRKGRMTA
jgi:uncharacterized membrane protein YphA (DoxX/SURF4 family)